MAGLFIAFDETHVEPFAHKGIRQRRLTIWTDVAVGATS